MLLLQIVSGWYYLLTQQIGQKKHLKVLDCRQEMITRLDNKIQNVNAVKNMQSHTVSNLQSYTVKLYCHI